MVAGALAGGPRVTGIAGTCRHGPRSIFEIGSITKVFTATLLAEMAREGLVASDDPVQKWLPEGVRMPSRGREITLEDLSTHRSGLPRLPKGLLLSALTRDRGDPYARLDPARLEAAIPVTRPRKAPGERFHYSNYAVGLLGYLLARRAGRSYERLVRTRICEPLGLPDMWVQTPVADRGAWRRRTTGGGARSGTGTSPPWPARAACARLRRPAGGGFNSSEN